MTAAERSERTRSADALCARSFSDAGCPEISVALVAVGGYGRGELAPHSDLDVVLVHDDDVETGDWAGQLWYPLWDSGVTIDHSVRSVSQVLDQAAGDLRVASGLLDVRHLAGDPNLTLRVRTAVLTAWRRGARERLPELHEMVRSRERLLGELAHASVPDLKESVGGLRDATVMKALSATWLVDVPRADLERCRLSLLDVRDHLHDIAGRANDRVGPEAWPQLADRLDLPDAVDAQRHVRGLGRRLTHMSRLTWRRVDSVLRAPTGTSVAARRPRLARVAEGIAVSYDEVVLDAHARVEKDPLLLLRAAAEASERDLVLAPTTVSHLVRHGATLPEPWPAEARDLFVRMLAGGRGLRGVWETLDEVGALEALLPEWEDVRLLPHASVVHRFTVDRHMVETCIEAAGLIRRVARPDVLMVAALLHDIGKGQLTEHCVAGEPIARQVATRMGFDEREVDLLSSLVRWHLLLPETATTRDPEDPATLELVLDRVAGPEELALLAALTEADARATSEKAWTSWRAGLIRSLVNRTARAMGQTWSEGPAPLPEEVPVPPQVRADPAVVVVEAWAAEDGTRLTIVSGDRVGLLADTAAMLALQRIAVRAARIWTQEIDGATYGVSVWEVDGDRVQPSVLSEQLEAIAAGRIDVVGRLAGAEPSRLEPTVAVRPEASQRATVLEVRSDDRSGLIHTVCRVLASMELAVTSAHVSTLGPQAVDVFYVQEAYAGALSDERASAAAHAVRQALAGSTAPTSH